MDDGNDAVVLSKATQIMPHVRLRYTKEVFRINVSSTGSLAVLAGKKALSVIGLTPPFAMAKELVHPGKAAPQGAQWSPHAQQASFMASHSGQSVFVWNLNDSRAALQSTITHKRNVRALSWSLFDPNILATCAADNAIHLWDLRDVKSPRAAQSQLKVFTSGLSNVRWNKLNSNLLASAHDQQVEIWDLRKSAPVTFITAHPTKITNIDWSPTLENHLITSSFDGTVKMWDVKKSRICQGTIHTGSPVLKAAYTQNGNNILVLNQPPAINIRIWSSTALNAEPVFELGGGKDVYPDFAYCERVGSGSHDVVSWSRDGHLCIWDVPTGVPQSDGSISMSSSPLMSPSRGNSTSVPSMLSPGPLHRGMSVPGVSAPTTEGAAIPGAPSSAPKTMQLKSLRDELDDLEHNPLPGIVTEGQIAALQRHVVVRTNDLHGKPVVIKIAFPSLYPHNAAPSFEFLPETQVSTEMMTTVVAALQNVCRRFTSQSRCCLRPALVVLSRTLQSAEEMEQKRMAKQASIPGSEQGPAVSEMPCPRLCGATFSASGRLVFFSNGVNFSVRTLTQLQEVLAGSPAPRPTSPAVGAPAPDEQHMLYPTVTHYNLPHLAHVSVTLAQHYRLGGAPIPELCHANADVAEKAGYSKVARAWKTLASIASSSDVLPLTHPMCRPLVKNILSHFESACDVQSVACMSRVLLSNRRPICADVEKTVQNMVEKHMLAVKAKPVAMLPPPPPVVEHVEEASSKIWTKRLFQKTVKKNRSGSDAPPPVNVATTGDFGAGTVGYLVSSPPASTPVAVATVSIGGSTAASAYVAPDVGLGAMMDVDDGDENSNNSNNHHHHDAAADAADPSLPSYEEPATPHFVYDHHQDPASKHCLLDPLLVPRYVSLQLIYADLCLYLSLVRHRAEMLQLGLANVHSRNSIPKGLSFEPTCPKCLRNVVGNQVCSSCSNALMFYCSLCRLPVRGINSVCSLCGHGGHTRHMLEWFRRNEECPTGCGCKCTFKPSGNV